MRAPNVVLFVIDGLRPDALSPERPPAIWNLIKRGAHTLLARTVMPSCTLPCHMSLFHSVPPERHGITSNVYTPPVRPIPGLFEAVKSSGGATAAFYNWEELRDLWRPGSVGCSYFQKIDDAHHGWPHSLADVVVAEQAAACFELEPPQLAFVYLGIVDEVGHRHGWMSEEYLAAVTRADLCVRLVCRTLSEEWGVIVTSDHGGHGRSHGTDCDEDMTVPFVIAGPGVPPDTVLERPVHITDIAPTIARWLDVDVPPQWEGSAVHFEASF